MGRHLVWLEEDELLTLDGKVKDKKVQEEITHIKNVTHYGQDLSFIKKVIVELEGEGQIGCLRRPVTCEICGDRSDIVRFKSGSRRNKTNHKQSKIVYGVSFAQDVITFEGRPRLGICDKCHERIKPTLKEELSKCRYDYHRYISSCPYRKDDERKCYSCGQTMYESEMGRTPTLMGQGTYPSTCPHCGAKALIFGRNHESTHRWRIIEVEKEKNEKN